jgi:hypothetical protein
MVIAWYKGTLLVVMLKEPRLFLAVFHPLFTGQVAEYTLVACN